MTGGTLRRAGRPLACLLALVVLLLPGVALGQPTGRRPVTPPAQPPAPALARLRVADSAVVVQWEGGVGRVEAAPVVQRVGGRWTVDSLGRATLAVGAAQLLLWRDLPVARAGAVAYPLAGAPVERDGRWWLPLQVFSELLPALEPRVRFDRSGGTLRGLAPAAATLPAPSASPTIPAVTTAVTPPRPTEARRRRVIVDPGHGGTDPGMRGLLPNGQVVREKDITLGVSRALARALEQRGHDVHLTRDRDTLIALSDRGRIANARRGDLFLSVHVNAAERTGPRSARGFETYFLAEAKTEDARRVQQMENEVVRFETPVAPDARDPLSFIVNDMAQNEHLRESLELASAIQSGLARRHPGPNRGVKQAEFTVLVRAFMPAVLIEIGFASNPTEAAWLVSPAGQQALAESIAEATDAYLGGYARRVGGDVP
jgi:N-acetylmuramoyl-L-alanine amidase